MAHNKIFLDLDGTVYIDNQIRDIGSKYIGLALSKLIKLTNLKL